MIKGTILAGLGLLLLASSPSIAQVATIDTRGQQPTSPSAQIIGGTGSGSSLESKALQVTFSVLDPQRLALGEDFDYEFVVTNKSDQNVLLPQSPQWSDVEDGSEQEPRYQELDISFLLIADKDNQASVQGNFVLYGKEADSTTMVLLAPGDTARILGTARFAPVWIHITSPPSKVRMQAYLAVNSARLRPVGNSHANRYREDERQIYWAQSENSIDVELPAAQ